MHPLKALKDILANKSETASGVVVSAIDGQLIVATSRGRVTVQTSEKITPGTKVTIDGKTVRVMSSIKRYQV